FVFLAVTGSVLGLAFAGSPGRIADGVSIDGVDVGGMTPGAAERPLESRPKKLEGGPLIFLAGDPRLRPAPPHTRVTPARRQLGVTADWREVVEVAQRHSGGFGPLRGFRRIGVRVFGADFAPPTRVYNAALEFELNRFSRALYRPHRDAELRLHGLQPVVV